MRKIQMALASEVAALLLCWPVARASAQSVASAAATAAPHNPVSQVAPGSFPLSPQSVATASATSANDSAPVRSEKTAAAIVPLPAKPDASPSGVAAVASTPVVTAPASASSPAGVRPVALIMPNKHLDETAAGRKAYDQASEDEHGNPMNWSLHIFKSRHRTEVFFKGRLLKVYHAVFGRSRWSGGKEWEGDTRTPEGSYLITQKRPSSRFDWFLKLNYPNGIDQEHFAAMKASHEISAGAREGGQVGIHGTDSPALNVRDVNWTLGCISVDNSDIEEMARLLPIGTLVVINP